MTHFLRNNENRTIISCDVGGNDLSSSTDIENYSMMLIDKHNKHLHYPFIKDISELSEIRGWWWEQAEDSGEYKSIDEFVNEKYLAVAVKHDLCYVTD